MTVALVTAISMSAGLALALVWMMHELIGEKDARREATLDAAHAEAGERNAMTALDTSERLRKAEAARSDALEEELAHADQDAVSTPDAGARARVLARWRESLRSTTPSGDAAGPVSHPAAADGDPGDVDPA